MDATKIRSFTGQNAKIEEFAKMLAPRLIQYSVLYALSGFSLAEEIFPFGISYLLNMSPSDIIPGAIFSTLGYWTLAKSAYLPKYIASILIGVVFKFFFFGKNAIPNKFTPLLSMFAMSVPVVCAAFITEITPYYCIMSAVEIMLAGAGSFFFSYARNSFEKSPMCSGKKGNISAVFFMCILTNSLMSISLFRVNLGAVFAALTICSFSYVKGEAYGCLIGSALAASSVIIGGSSDLMPMICCLGGLFTGIFRKIGKTALAVCFTITAAMLALSSQEGDFSLIFGALAGSIIFAFTPSEAIRDFIGGYRETGEDSQVKSMCMLIKNKLELLSEGLLEIKKTTNTVSAVKFKSESERYDIVYESVCSKFCQYCPNNSACWQTNYTVTTDIVDRLINKLKQNKEIFPSDYPPYFKENCSSYMDLSEAITDGYNLFLINKKNKRRMEELRGVVTEQLEGISGMIKKLSENVDNIYRSDLYLQSRIFDYFSHKKIELKKCLCFYSKDGILTVHIDIPIQKLPQINNNFTVLDLSDICERDLSLPRIIKKEDIASLTYAEAAKYQVEMGFIQKNSEKEEVCGDCLRQIPNYNSFAYVILSDGMGTGKRASIESTMTTDMLTDLILRGSDCENAVKVINSSLICKSSAECFATVDIACVNLYTGCCEFFKSAAAPTYMLKEGKASCIRSCSLPVGILKNISADKSSVTLGDGDLIVNLTDGVTESGEDWILSQLEYLKDRPPQEIAEELYKKAIERSSSEYHDDMTLSVLKLKKLE